MLKMKKIILISVFTGLWACCSGVANADTKLTFLNSCPFQVGDPIEKVKKFYGVNHEPMKMVRITPNGSVARYHFPEYGVWVFFDENTRIKVLRFDRPFTGKIGRIAIGDSMETVRQTWGEPLRVIRGLPDQDLHAELARKRQKVLDALPDPAPKQAVLKMLDDLARLNFATADKTFMTAWIYKTGGHLSFDFGVISNQVQTILSDSCYAK